jgi:hypothetical protein
MDPFSGSGQMHRTPSLRVVYRHSDVIPMSPIVVNYRSTSESTPLNKPWRMNCKPKAVVAAETGLASLRGARYPPASAGPSARRRDFDRERPTSER